MTTTELVEPSFVEDIESGIPRNYTLCGRRKEEDGESDSSWGEDTELYIRNLLEKCEQSAKAHEAAGYKSKTLHTQFAFPATVIPTIAAPIMGTFKDSEWSAYFGMTAMVLTAITSGVGNFFNYGGKSQQHFNFSGRYGDIVTDIQECLAKKVNKRQSASVTMRTMKLKFDALNLSAPPV